MNTTNITVSILPTDAAFPTWKKGSPVVDIISCSKKEWEENKKDIVTKALHDLIIDKVSTWSSKTVTWSYNGEDYKCFSDPETRKKFVKNARKRIGLEQTEENAINALDSYRFASIGIFARLF